MDKPGLSNLVGSALKSKGLVKNAPAAKGEEDKAGAPDDAVKEHLKLIAKDLLDAIEAKDVDAIADLLHEACESVASAPADADDASPADAKGGTKTSSDVKSPTKTSTSTSTKANTTGNFTATVTGGAGDGATSVHIHPIEQKKKK